MEKEVANGVEYFFASPYHDYPICTVPAGEIGEAHVSKFTIEGDTAFIHNMQAAIHGNRQMSIPPGDYTRLHVGGELMMSDTPWELGDMREMRRAARLGRYCFHISCGHALVHGLGLGCAVELLFYEGMEKVTVVELSQDVIDLVGPHLKSRHGDKLEIVCADALTWKPPKGMRYSIVWHDIWPTICLDNLPQIKKLNRRYGGKCDWQSYWAKREMKKMKREYRDTMEFAYSLNPKGSEKYEKLVELDKKNKEEIGI